MKQSAEMRSALLPTTLWRKSQCEVADESVIRRLQNTFRGQAVKQSAEMRSALEFFATAQSCRERSLESVNRVTDIGFSGFPGFLGFSGSEKFKTSPLVPAHPS